MSAVLLNDQDGRAVPMTLPEFGRRAPPPSLAELDALREQSSREGFIQGHAEGLARGSSEVRRLQAELGSILEGFQRPLQQLDLDVKSALSELAVVVAGALVGHAMASDPVLMTEMVEQAIADLGRERRAVDVRLHPDDLVMIDALLERNADVRLLGDTSLARGDCRVHTEQLRIDASLGTRLRAIIAELHSEPRSA
jgi:flagellar assembly protein FliH